MTIEELIRKYLTHELTGEEERRLKTWLSEDKANRKVFENIVAGWQLTGDDIRQSKARIYGRLSAKYRSEKKPRRFIPYFSKVAAVFVFAVAAALMIFYIRDEKNQTAAPVAMIEKQTLPGQKLTIKLPDGSVAILNSASRIVSPESFQNAERKVRLEGEAFFEVAEDASRPFIIVTDNLNVRVLGTSFNVRSFSDEDNVSVAVLSGKVMVSESSDSMANQRQILLPNEMLEYSVKEKSFSEKKRVDSSVVFGWKDQNLVFKDENIDRILVALSRWYGVEFDVQAPLDYTRKFTGNFKNPTLKEVMESISYSYQFEYNINDRNIIIK